MPRYTVYWQPGCTSCLATKEFLRAHGIDFESVNVREAPGAAAALAKLGARSVPVVARGDDFVYGQDLEQVARFVGIATSRARLDVPVLVARLIALLDTSAHLTAHIPRAAWHRPLPGRERTRLDLAWHVPQVVIGFLDAAGGGCLAYEHFERKPPPESRSAAACALVARQVSQSLAQWWAANWNALPAEVDTYYGRQPLHGVLERTVWHVAQHARQLERLLEIDGAEATPRIPSLLLDGLPLPGSVWDAEVPIA